MAYSAVIEVLKDTKDKYEIGKDGSLVFECEWSVEIPLDYGYINETLADDSDNLDVLVIAKRGFTLPEHIEIAPIGYLNMIDNGETDNKVIAVLAEEYDEFSLDRLDVGGLKAQVEEFLHIIKKDEGVSLELNGWHNKDEAIKLIEECRKRYEDATR